MIYGGHTYHLDDLGQTVTATVKGLKPHSDKFDFIVVTGVSGIIVGAPVAVALDVPLVVIRKTTEKCHDEQDVVNYAMAKGRWLFLDDFISLGTTIEHVQDRMSKPLKKPVCHGPAAPKESPTYAGYYMYDHHETWWKGEEHLLSPEEPSELLQFSEHDIDLRDLAEKWCYVSANSTPMGVWQLWHQRA